jgi:hypothetical protein
MSFSPARDVGWDGNVVALSYRGKPVFKITVTKWTDG